jgi:hypothetical protein
VVGHHLLNPPTYHAQTRTDNKTCRPEMHELPKDLGNSLRSFRNSVHRYSGQHDFDLEKLETPNNVIDSESERHVHETSSSLILVFLYKIFLLGDLF